MWPTPGMYKRRRPERTVLYRLVREHAETLFAEASERSATGAGYPRHVENEFRRYLDCGVLSKGFMRVRCDACQTDELVGFSCKGRAFCPSCLGRRMSDSAARLCEDRLPEARYRQWVFSFPWRIRVLLAKESALWSEVLSVCHKKVFAYQRRVARALGVTRPGTFGVSFTQRFGSLLTLNPHAHSVVPDAVCVETDKSELELRELPPPSDADVEAIGLAIAKAVLAKVARWADRGEEEDDSAHVLALREAAQSTVWDKDGGQDAVQAKRRQVLVQTEIGCFSIDADRSVSASDRAGLEKLLRYCGRPPLAQNRLSIRPSGKVSYRLRKPYFTGQTEVVLEPVAFLRRLAALVPPPRQNHIRFYGLLSSQAKRREAFLKLVKKDVVGEGEPTGELARVTISVTPEAEEPKAPGSTYRLSWARLLARVFKHAVLTCKECGGKRRIVSAITELEVAHRILAHLNLPTETPVLEPARAPPQLELSDLDEWSPS